MAWLSARCAFCLNHDDPNTAVKKTKQILAMNHACLIRHYPALLALDASLKTLNGKSGGIQTAANLLQAAPISPKYERDAFRALADLPPQFTTPKLDRILSALPQGKECTFWLSLMGASIAYNLSLEPAPLLPASQTPPSLALLAKAFSRYIQKH